MDINSIRKLFRSRSRSRRAPIIAAALIAGAALDASAADRTFQNAGGDLASTDSADWGGTAPGSSDKAIVNKPGDYTLTGDVSFGTFNVTTGGCNFAFGSRKITGASITCTPSGGNPVVFNGGVLDLSGNRNISACASYRNLSTVIFTNGCVITNANNFYVGNASSDSNIEIADGVKAFLATLRIAHTNATNITLDIHDGGQVFLSDRFYSDSGENVEGHGGNVLRVRGTDSQLTVNSGNANRLGFYKSDNTFHVDDGGGVEFTSTASLQIGSSGAFGMSTNNAFVVERSATATIPTVKVEAERNRIFVGDGATLTAPTLQVNAGLNEVVVSNATLGSRTEFSLASTPSATGNILRAIGSDTYLAIATPEKWFADGHHNLISLEGGAKWAAKVETFCTNTHHCVLRVTGAGTEFGEEGTLRNFYVGSKDYAVTDACASNSVEVLDGAVFRVARLPLMGIGNALVVSNATAQIAAGTESVGLRVGYIFGDRAPRSSGCMLKLCGKSPRVVVGSTNGNACWFANNAILRFEIPKEGYDEGVVPLEMTTGCALHFDEGCRLEIDCAEFVAHTGGKLHLIQAGANFNADTKARLSACASTLPAGCTLIVEDKDVWLQAPSRAATIITFH